MTFKKALKTQRAQSTVEYFVLFAIIAVLTLLSVTEFFPAARSMGERFYNKAVNAMN